MILRGPNTMFGRGRAVVAAIVEFLNKYRYQQPILFQSAQPIIQPRVAGGGGWSNDGFGPNYWYVDKGIGWPWDRLGGDWLDSTQTRWGATPWLKIFATNFVGLDVAYVYSGDLTAAMQFIQSNGRWNAYLVAVAGTYCKLAGPANKTLAPPSIDVVYTDSTTVTLACRIMARIDASTTSADTTLEISNLPVFLEFDPPTKAVASATVRITVPSNPARPTPVIVFQVVDPTVNTNPTVLGIANGTDLDAGLVGNPAVIGMHRYLAGSTLADFNDPGVGATSSEEYFDPYIWGRGPHDYTKYPHAGLGKWIGNLPTWSMVDDNYTADGYVPLSPGLNAIRMDMPRISTGDGTLDGYGGTSGGSNKIFMPEPLFGALDNIFVRHYMRLGTPNGAPYRFPIDLRYQQMHANPTVNFSYTPAVSGPINLNMGNTVGLLSGRTPLVESLNPAVASKLYYGGSTTGTAGVATSFSCTANGALPGTITITPDDGGAGGTFGTPTFTLYNNQGVNWTDAGGKFGIMPGHETTDGGVSGSSGGGFGWQMRNSWTDCSSDTTGPDLGGWVAGLHTFDFGVHQPVGYNYSGSDTPRDRLFGQIGGMGTIYADKWYCLEAQVKLNTVPTDGSSGFTPDGEIRFWIDGRLVFERTGMVMRSMPLQSSHGINPAFIAGIIRPCRTIGVKELWFNWFHGGLTQSSMERCIFVTGLVWGTSYIGPMQFPVSTP